MDEPIQQNRPRIFYDVSHQTRHVGPPTGIIRVDRELARWADAHLRSVSFVLYDPSSESFRQVKPHLARDILADNIFVDWSRQPKASDGRRRPADRILRALGPASSWFLRPRPQIIYALDRLRVRCKGARLASAVAAFQRLFFDRRYRNRLFKIDGSRRTIVRQHDLLIGPLTPAPGDIVVVAGAGWGYMNVDALRELKARFGCRVAFLCYDLIPLNLPQYQKPRFAGLFGRFIDAIFRIADLVLFSARAIEDDARRYCASRDIAMPPSRIIRYGVSERWKTDEARHLPAGLEAEKYILYVSTLDARKNHRLLYEIWLDLLAEHVPQRTGFKLVFVGRVGDGVEELVRALQRDDRVRGSLLHLLNVYDDQLCALYRGAAFCVFPSCYEGFGLSVIESLRYGKPILVSTGGALPEAVAGFSPTLDPYNRDAWRSTLREWILNPQLRESYEQRIRLQYRPVTWEQAAEQFFETVLTALSTDGGRPAVDVARAP
jgi:glycosyltransferase involved in cell wall biosynthesis